MTDEELAVLKSELETDPNGYGYAPYIAAGDMQTLADLLNLRRTDVYVFNKVLREEALACFDLGEIEIAYADQPGTLELACHLLGYPSFTLDNSTPDRRIYNTAKNSFTDYGSLTYDAMNAIMQRNGARAEYLFGSGRTVAWYDCKQALHLT